MDGVGDVQMEEIRSRGAKSLVRSEAFGVDSLHPSFCTFGWIKMLCENYGILDSVTIRIPEHYECLSQSKNLGETLIHPYMFREGLRLSLHSW